MPVRDHRTDPHPATPRLRHLLTTERPRPDAIRTSPRAWRLAVATVCFGAFMGQLDASIVTLTYRPLRNEFHTTLAGVEWVSLAYLLTLVALLVPAGRLSDARGRKLMYLYGFAVFTAASAACGLAPTLTALVAFRTVQAAGAALMQANSVALVTTSAPPGKMRPALGIQAAGQALGLALGPTIGGALVATVGWRWVFGVNVPIGVIALIAGHYLLPRTRQRATSTRIDTAAVLLLAATTTCALLALSIASGLRLPLWTALALAGAAILAGWAFTRRQHTHPRPLVDLALLRTGGIGPGLAAGLCGYLVLFGPLVLVPVDLDRHGTPPLIAGLVLTALPLGFALAATTADRLLPAAWTDQRRSRYGAAGCIAALAVLAAVPQQPALLPGPLALLGLALGVFIPANNTLVMKAIPATAAGTGGGMVNMTRGLGTAIGVAAVTLALHLGGTGTGARTATLVLLAFAALAWALGYASHHP
ncbi:MFS transporter [Kitasatospora purpeofusca]|uniref:MFS transporter n=1 Tax=Kitasatospora purpeofusca TaxID=67352 RepID=UPI00224EE23F|nr:MFS transporter [Kitasatospora purpeofusca]MCX4757167.1 MFS transporter [Kitasatospora purpeofusca]WSR35073.1 MFS transporter [Kitasatospora purpeofusca]WSR43396.1 MFS transporter [Kitasatospora purpeofusca]